LKKQKNKKKKILLKLIFIAKLSKSALEIGDIDILLQVVEFSQMKVDIFFLKE